VKLNKGQFKVRGFQICVCPDYVFLGCDTMQSYLVYTGISEEGVTSLVFEVSRVRLPSGYRFPAHSSRLLCSMCGLCFMSATLTLSK